MPAIASPSLKCQRYRFRLHPLPHAEAIFLLFPLLQKENERSIHLRAFVSTEEQREAEVPSGKMLENNYISLSCTYKILHLKQPAK
jgi:hypothetical protein